MSQKLCCVEDSDQPKEEEKVRVEVRKEEAKEKEKEKVRDSEGSSRDFDWVLPVFNLLFTEPWFRFQIDFR